MSEAKRPARSTSASTLSEPPAGPSGDPALREVFLSPRVVDREAFNDFSGSLRKLIEQAAGQGDSLRQVATEATAAHQQLRELAGKHTTKFELAAKAMAALDERSAKAEQMLLAVQEAALSLDTFRTDAERIVSRETMLLDQRVEDAVARMTQRIDEMVARASRQLEEAAGTAEMRASEACRRAAAVQSQLDGFGEVAEAKMAEMRQAISGMEARAVRSVEDAAANSRRSFDGVCELLSNHAEELRLSLAAGAEMHRERLDQLGEARIARLGAEAAGCESRIGLAAEQAINRIDSLQGTAAAEVASGIETMVKVREGGVDELRQTQERVELAAQAGVSRIGGAGDEAAARARAAAEESLGRISTIQQAAATEIAASIQTIGQARDISVSQVREAGRSVEREAEAATARLQESAGELIGRAEEQQRRLTDILLRVEEASGEAETLIGLTIPLPDEDQEEENRAAAEVVLPGSLADLVLRARRSRKQAETALLQLESTREQLEQARAALGRNLAESSDWIDALSGRAEELRRTLAESLGACERAAQSLCDGRTALEQAAAAPMADLQARSEELREQIASMSGQTERAREISHAVVEQTTKVLRGLSELLVQLKPWQPLLMEQDASAPLPEPLRRLVEQVRGEIAGDLSTIASGLQQVAFRAQRVSETVQAG